MIGAAAVAGLGFYGALLATYTGVLIGVTVIPAWHLHRVMLPIHFGMVGLGSAVGVLELLGHRTPAIGFLGYTASVVETILWLLTETNRHGAADRAVHEGESGWMIRISDLCTGLISLLLRTFGGITAAAIAFCAGGVLSRFGWIRAGEVSGKDPESVFASQRPKR